MNDQDLIKPCLIETGNFVGSAWGSNPEWTPYARAIAAYYPSQPLWYETTLVTIAAPPPSLTTPRVFQTRPNKYDVLIFGMSATQSPAVNDPVTPSGNLYVQFEHLETGLSWVMENQIGYVPLGAVAGMDLNVMPVQQLPEAFFLPAHTTLKISFLPWTLDTTPTVNARLTMLGVQLINNTPGFTAPKTVKMPNGQEIPVGGRLPWFACIPFGLRPSPSNNRPFGDFTLGPRVQAVQYTPGNNCVVEVHGAYASFLDSTAEFTTGNPTELLISKMNPTRKGDTWTPVLTPVQATFGSVTQVNVSSPFPKPVILDRDQRIQLVEQNNDTSAVVTHGTITYRGVRLCEF